MINTTPSAAAQLAIAYRVCATPSLLRDGAGRKSSTTGLTLVKLPC